MKNLIIFALVIGLSGCTSQEYDRYSLEQSEVPGSVWRLDGKYGDVSLCTANSDNSNVKCQKAKEESP